MIYFHYLFYYLYKGYLQKGEKIMPGLFTVSLMSVILFFNICSCILLFLLFFKIENISVNPAIGGILIGVIFLFNYLYFYGLKSKEKVLKLFSIIKRIQIRRLSVYILVYIFSSILLMIVTLALYINS